MSKADVNIDASEDAFAKKALTWFVSLSQDGQTCPICGAEFFDGTEAEKNRNLTAHGRTKHMSRIAIGYPTRNIDAMSSVDDTGTSLLEEAGLEVFDTLDRYDVLAVSADVRKVAEKDGASLRWASQEKMARWDSHGMEVVKDANGKAVESSGLTLMRIPNRLRNVYADRRAKLRGSGPAARKEDLERNIEGHAKSMYDAAIKKGLGRDVAKNLSNAAERGLATGVLNIRRG